MTAAFIDTPQVCLSMQENRLSLRHGPIDLFVSVDGANENDKLAAYKFAISSFETILPDLCTELEILRRQITIRSSKPTGLVAAKMFGAASHFANNHFVTPMIAVAGSVADHLVNLMGENVEASRIFVNNGGDISLYLSEDEKFKVGICSDIKTGHVGTYATIHAEDEIGGIATSGWGGRSHSLGIADSVTVFASSAAMADAAATLIANHVDLPNSPKVNRIVATELAPDSDLGDRLVTTHVAPLTDFDKQHALEAGYELAIDMMQSGLIHSAYLSLQNVSLVAHPEGACVSSLVQSSVFNVNPEHTGLVNA